MQTLAESLQERFESIAGDLLPAVLKLTARANKVYVVSATQTLKAAISATDGLPTFLPALAAELASASKSVRIAAADCIHLSLTLCNPGGRVDAHAEEVERALLSGITDPATEVRTICKGAFDAYRVLFPLRIER